MTKKQQVHDLINTLRERSHVVEFAEKCAKRAKGYARHAAAAYDDYAAARAYARATRSDYAAARAGYAVYAYAAEAAEAADYAVYATVDYATYAERDIQITHLKELHVREESCLNVKKSMDVGKGGW